MKKRVDTIAGTKRLFSTRRTRIVLAGGVVAALLAVLAVQLSDGPAVRADILLEQPATSGPGLLLPADVEPTATESSIASPAASPAETETAPAMTPILAVVDDSHMVLPPSCGTGDNLESCPDGKPGWWAGFTSCTVPIALDDAPGPAPLDGMTLALTLPQSQVTAGQALTGTLTATNPTEYRVSFTISYLPWGDSELTATVLGPGGGGAVYSSDVMVSEPMTLEPGASVALQVIVPTATCGDTSSDLDLPLAAGEYAVTAAIHFSDTKVEPVSQTSTSPSPDARVGDTPSPTPTPSASASDQPSPDEVATDQPSSTPSGSPVMHDDGMWAAAMTFTVT